MSSEDELRAFEETYHDLVDRLGRATDIIEALWDEATSGRGTSWSWSWSGEFNISNGQISATMYRYCWGEKDEDEVSFPLELLYTHTNDELAELFRKGQTYAIAVEENRRAAVLAASADRDEAKERAEFARLTEKYGS